MVMVKHFSTQLFEYDFHDFFYFHLIFYLHSSLARTCTGLSSKECPLHLFNDLCYFACVNERRVLNKIKLSNYLNFSQIFATHKIQTHITMRTNCILMFCLSYFDFYSLMGSRSNHSYWSGNHGEEILSRFCHFCVLCLFFASPFGFCASFVSQAEF